MECGKHINSLISMVKSSLDELLSPASSYPEDIHSAMRYAVFPGGKRFRPVLVLSAYEAFAKKPNEALPFACAVELIHSYSLAHDDLPSMDNDDFRRGKPSLHKKFGEALAILTGDALLTKAFQIISDDRLIHFNTSVTLKAIQELSSSAGAEGMVGGQSVDIRRTGSHTASELSYIHLMKTAGLIKSSVRIGSILGGASNEQLSALTEYGLNLGLAFQMLDDINDQDITSAEPNFAGFLTPELASRKAGEYVNKARASLASLDKDTTLLKCVLDFMIKEMKQ
jgi:geranylgeranyl diphosphate synthase, type II